jgi:SAM-dependent methyltransferase
MEGKVTAAVDSDAMYDRAYYDALREGTRRSAEIIVPHLITLFEPESVVDVGCGAGLWLEAFRRHGIGDFLGLDGDWAGDAGLAIPRELFRVADLEMPVRLERRFDLVLCLEVAEHLPPAAAPTLIETLTRLGPAVVFSAAIPFQRGRGHVNERWPSYWSKRFAEQGFTCIDALRERFWTDQAIEVWYRQNLVIFADAGWLAQRTQDSRAAFWKNGARDLVHPDHYLKLVDENAEWRRYTELLKIRVANLEAELGVVRKSVLGRLQRVLGLADAALRRQLSRRHPSSIEGTGRSEKG